MSPEKTNRNPSAPFLFITGVLIGAGGLFLVLMQNPRPATHIAPDSVPPATSEMAVPIIEVVKPTDEGKKQIDGLEEELLHKLEGVPEDSPERFERYGIFAQQAEGAGMYDLAEVYYKKAFVQAPTAYKAYFSKPAADFQINWSSMYVDRGKLDEAASIAEKVYNQEVKILGAESVQAIESGTTYASDLGYIKRYKEKQALSEKLIALLEKMGKTKEEDYVAALRCLGESYQGQNNLPEAKRWYLKALGVSSANQNLHTDTENLEQTLAGFSTIQVAPETK